MGVQPRADLSNVEKGIPMAGRFGIEVLVRQEHLSKSVAGRRSCGNLDAF